MWRTNLVSPTMAVDQVLTILSKRQSKRVAPQAPIRPAGILEKVTESPETLRTESRDASPKKDEVESQEESTRVSQKGEKSNQRGKGEGIEVEGQLQGKDNVISQQSPSTPGTIPIESSPQQEENEIYELEKKMGDVSPTSGKPPLPSTPKTRSPT